MSNYIIFLGGTGARCADALCHMFMAGMTIDEKEPIHILLGDADDQNGNTSNTVTLFRNYIALQDALNISDSKFHIAKQKITFSRWVIGNKLFDDDADFADRQVNLEYLNRSNSDEDIATSRNLMKALYTPTEMQNRISAVGFFAHPNVGAAVLRASILNEDDKARAANAYISEYGEFRTNIVQELFRGNDVQLFLVGSIFGGTGASCVPGIAQDIRSRCQDEAVVGTLSVSSMLLLPYFHLTPKSQAEQTYDPSKSFQLASKTALKYYAKQNYLFERTYLIGLPRKTSIETTERGGDKQKNHAMLPEWEAALACFHFFKTYEKPAYDVVNPITAVYYKGCDFTQQQLDVGWNCFSWNAFEASNISSYLGQYTRFALFYLHKLYSDIHKMKIGKLLKANFYLKYLSIFEEEQTTEEIIVQKAAIGRHVEALREQCAFFVQWLTDSLADDQVKQAMLKNEALVPLRDNQYTLHQLKKELAKITLDNASHSAYKNVISLLKYASFGDPDNSQNAFARLMQGMYHACV